MKITQTLETDVLVIGAGGAGLRAALAAAESDAAVIVTNKGPVGKSGITLTAAGGMQAPFHGEDSSEHYFQDTITCGYHLGDQNLAQALAEDACARVLDLERYGVQFNRNSDGSFALGQFPGQSRPRNLVIKGGGIGLVSSLARRCRENTAITLLEDFFVTGLVTAGRAGKRQVAGALGLNLKTGVLTLIKAKAVVMATGGCQWLWQVTDCPADATGDGVMYAYRAGAELVDMEMVLFYPSVIVWPPSLKGAFAHYEFLDETMLDGNIYDSKGKAVLPKPLPVRDQAMRIMAAAIHNGQAGNHGGLMWYVGDSPKGTAVLQKTLSSAQYTYIKAHGVDPVTSKLEVAPGTHYLLGGISINECCQTTLAGLFATPECAGNFDGANRLAGSGITATQVFGARAGLSAGKWAHDNPAMNADQASIEEEIERVSAKLSRTKRTDGDRIALEEKLRSAMQTYAGVNRDAEGLTRLVEITREVRDAVADLTAPATSVYNQQLVDLLQLEIMAEAAGIVAVSALARQESRGHHYRTDFPTQQESWLRHTAVVQGDSGPQIGTRPVITR